MQTFNFDLRAFTKWPLPFMSSDYFHFQGHLHSSPLRLTLTTEQHHSGVPSWRCSSRTLVQPTSLVVCISAFIFAFRHWKADLMGWGHLTDLVFDPFPLADICVHSVTLSYLQFCLICVSMRSLLLLYTVSFNSHKVTRLLLSISGKSDKMKNIWWWNCRK